MKLNLFHWMVFRILLINQNNFWMMRFLVEVLVEEVSGGEGSGGGGSGGGGSGGGSGGGGSGGSTKDPKCD